MFSYYLNAGDCYEMTGQTDLAIESFKEAIKVHKDEVHLMQAHILKSSLRSAFIYSECLDQ